MSGETNVPGIHADLQSLIRLQYKAQGFAFLPRQPIHSVLSGRHASRLRGRGLDFEEIRRYLPGDDIRSIDWRVTARTKKAHVRVYSEERDRPCLLLVDQRQSMFFGTRRAMKSVVAAEAAALGAWRVLSVGDRVGALVFDDEEIVEVRPHRSRNRVMRILRAVTDKNQALSAEAKAPPGPGMLNEALGKALRLAKHDHLIAVITDLVGADDDTLRLVTRLAEHNDVILIFVHDPMEARMPDVGRLVAAHGELQLEVDTSDSGLRRRFGEEFEERFGHAKRLLQRVSTPVLNLSTHEEVPEQIRRALGHLAPTRR